MGGEQDGTVMRVCVWCGNPEAKRSIGTEEHGKIYCETCVLPPGALFSEYLRTRPSPGPGYTRTEHQ